jgi:hypothetical protein
MVTVEWPDPPGEEMSTEISLSAFRNDTLMIVVAHRIN